MRGGFTANGSMFFNRESPIKSYMDWTIEEGEQ